MATIHRDHGVETIFEDVVTRFEGDGRVERVITKRGRRLDCDFAVVGVGVEPVVDFVAGSGDRDRQRDPRGRVLPHERSRTFTRQAMSPITITRSFRNGCASSTGRTRCSRVPPPPGACSAKASRTTPSTGSGRISTTSTCSTPGSTRSGTRSSCAAVSTTRTFIAFYLNQGRIDAVVALNRGKDVRRVMPLIKARDTVDPRQLGDEGMDLRSLVESRLSGAHT